MGLKDCVITLDNQWNTYYPGQTINGQVTYTFDSIKKIRGISIKFKGIAETSWQTHENRRDPGSDTTKSVPVTYSGNEEYFSISYYLLGSKNGDAIELPPGTHSYPFTCALPPTLPSSFEGEHGFVRYTVKATLDRPWKFDQETKMAFTVVSHKDLNTIPECKAPIHIEMRERFCCCWCKSGPLTVDVSLPVSGYCSGQAMPIDINVENGSNVQVQEIEIQFNKHVRFHAHSPRQDTKEDTIMISSTKTGSVDENTTTHFTKSLEIPPLPPSSLTNCSIIDVDYELEVSCIIGGCHFDLSKKHPITIGTVPFVDYQPPPPSGVTVTAIPEVPQSNQLSSAAPLLGQPQSGYPQPYPAAYPPVNPPFNPQMSATSYPGYPTNGNPAPSPYPYPNPSAPQMDGSNIQQVGVPQIQPMFCEGQFAAKSIHDSADGEHTKISGKAAFAPCYPTYGFVIPPQNN